MEGTVQVTYPGEDGTSLVVSQAPPDRRIDVVVGERVVESRVLRGGVGYRCAIDSGGDRLEATAYTTDVLDGTFET